ncbi:hypothetical protein BD289DRAFT_502241 [Coniella lustricola]|uniref:Uncharacterized protein n=1 Tax=Coniella lustricola TaxID=2025994 RepID=A0A2T3ALU0_9PEZI|nr:hypothetical protein BD289DRAFT_502241 [Coniella lustricola]
MYVSDLGAQPPPDLKPIREMTDFERGMYISTQQSITLERKLWKRTGLFSCILVLFWVVIPVILMAVSGTLICQFAVPGGRSMSGAEALSQCNALGAYEMGVTYTLANIAVGVIGGFVARILYKRVYRRIKEYMRRHRMTAEEKREYHIRRRLRERQQQHQRDADVENEWLRRRQDAVDEAKNNYYAKFKGYEAMEDNNYSPEFVVEQPEPAHMAPELRMRHVPPPQQPPPVAASYTRRHESPAPAAGPFFPAPQPQHSPPQGFVNTRTRRPGASTRGPPPPRDRGRGSDRNQHRDDDGRDWEGQPTEQPHFDNRSDRGHRSHQRSKPAPPVVWQ